MLIKKILPAAITAALLSGGTLVQAQEEKEAAIVTGEDLVWEIAGNVALVSDYRFRGISQSDEDLALQGGFDASWSPGFYVGIWGSTVDFDTNGLGFDGSLELDYYAGFSSDINDSWSYDVGYMYYDYPGDDGGFGDYQEIYGSVSWNDLTVGVNYSDDYYAETDEFFYVYGNYSFSLPYDIALDLHAGYNSLEETKYDSAGNVTDGGFLATDEDGYADWSISLTKTLMGIDFSIAYVDTSLDEEDVFDTDWAEATGVFTISKSL